MDTRIWAVRGRAAMGLAVALLLGVSVAACDDDDDEPTGPSSTIVDLASSSPNLQTLTAAILAAGLDDELSAPGSYTVFAPTDAAFGVLGEESVQALLADENADVLEELLLGHAVAGTYASSDLSDGQILTTLSGDELEVTVSNGVARVGGVAVETADLEATNGVVHVVGGVLTGGLDAVQLARIVPDLSTLVTAVTAAELEGTLSSAGPFTVFAPVNSAFADLDSEALGRLLAAGNQELLQQVLTYHVVAGEIMAADLEDGAEVATVEGSTLEIGLGDGATVNGANIIATDIRVENGVIHLIDEVLLQNLDIVDVAILNGFDSLVGAVQAAGLESALRDESASLTVFAPTEAAFEAIAPVPSDPSVLEPILLYHVIGAEAYSADLADGQVLVTLQGSAVTVQKGAGVQVEGAQNTAGVALADVPASNGVIHVIDAVLLPPTN